MPLQIANLCICILALSKIKNKHFFEIYSPGQCQISFAAYKFWLGKYSPFIMGKINICNVISYTKSTNLKKKIIVRYLQCYLSNYA